MTRAANAPAVEWRMKKSEAPAIVTAERVEQERKTSAPRIRCPRCHWQPKPSSTWFCISGPGPEPPFESCGTAWNTFDTGGRCPGCSHQWQWTTCLHCHEWSPHLDWYEDRDEAH